MRLPVFFPLSLLLFPGRQLWKAGSLTRRPSKEKKKKTTATNYWQQQRTFAQLSAAYSRVIIGRQTAMASRRKSQRERGNPPVVSWDVQTPERQSRGNLSCFIHAIDGWMDAWPSVAYAQHNKGPSPIHSEWRMRIGSSQRHWANEKTAFANIILAAACNFRSVLPADREGKKIDTNSDCVSEKKSILYVGLLWI